MTILASKPVRNGELLTLERLSRPVQGKDYVLIWQTPASKGRKANVLDSVYFHSQLIAQNRFDRSI